MPFDKATLEKERIKMFNRKTFSILAATVLVGGLIGSANAAIVLEDSGGYAFVGTASSHTITPANLGGFNANGTDKLVVTVTGERAGTSNNTVSGITYGGVSLTKAVAAESTSPARKMSIWYLDNVSVTGNIVVSYVQSQSGIGISAVALNGTVDGVADTALPTESITTTIDGEFVIAAAIANGGAISASSPLSPLLSSADGSTGSSTGAAGYYVVPTAGDFTPAFAGDEAYVAAAFEPFVVPEPASLATGLLGLTLIIARRRKA
jgi:hypothetical protein